MYHTIMLNIYVGLKLHAQFSLNIPNKYERYQENYLPVFEQLYIT